jgi:hypothetical protein
MKNYFVSFVNEDRKVAEQVATALRKDNPAIKFSWVEKLSDGEKGWFGPIAKALREADGVVCVMASRAAATDPWIGFEMGAAIGGGKRRLILLGPGLEEGVEFSKPLQGLQRIVWSNKPAVQKGLESAGLQKSDNAVRNLMAAFQPPVVLSCKYGRGGTWYTFSTEERGAFTALLDSMGQVEIGNQLIGNRDPIPGTAKVLRVEVKRAGERYVRMFDEKATISRRDLW